MRDQSRYLFAAMLLLFLAAWLLINSARVELPPVDPFTPATSGEPTVFDGQTGSNGEHGT